jgi:hypothetical protein
MSSAVLPIDYRRTAGSLEAAISLAIQDKACLL